MQIMNTALATSRDVLLVFSYSGSTKDMEDTLQIAREHGVSIILVTHYPNSRAAQFADVVLLCGYNEGPLQSGSIPAKVGQLLLIDCLFYGFLPEKIQKPAPQQGRLRRRRLRGRCCREMK